MAAVEARVAHGFVAVAELVLSQLVAAADALGDRIAGDLEMNASGPGASGSVSGKILADLSQDGVEVARLDPVFGAEGIAVHGVALPYHRVAGVGDRPQDGFEALQGRCRLPYG